MLSCVIRMCEWALHHIHTRTQMGFCAFKTFIWIPLWHLTSINNVTELYMHLASHYQTKFSHTHTT